MNEKIGICIMKVNIKNRKERKELDKLYLKYLLNIIYDKKLIDYNVFTKATADIEKI